MEKNTLLIGKKYVLIETTVNYSNYSFSTVTPVNKYEQFYYRLEFFYSRNCTKLA